MGKVGSILYISVTTLEERDGKKRTRMMPSCLGAQVTQVILDLCNEVHSFAFVDTYDCWGVRGSLSLFLPKGSPSFIFIAASCCRYECGPFCQGNFLL